jgi:HD domain
VNRVPHLVARFFASLRPRPLDAATLAWVARVLEPAELQVWEGLGPADRAESVAVARRFVVERAGAPEPPDATWIAAALLHDVGKQASAYGPVRRALVTLVVAGAGSERVRGWTTRPGRVRPRMGRYAAHDDLGAARLRGAGSRPETAAWAEAHHRPELWKATGIPPGVCRALAIADGDRGSE